MLAGMRDAWTIFTLLPLAIVPGYRLRFLALRNGIEGIARRMLKVTLRNLDYDGLLVRQDLAKVPPRVAYELTPMGASPVTDLEGFTSWTRER